MSLSKSVTSFPTSPGVYLMKDKNGRVIYVGKAKDLHDRIRSYFSSTNERYQVQFLMKRVTSIDTVVTQTEKEAFLLENSLIKKYKPRYNIDLKDDKSYVSVMLSVQDKFPRIYLTRRIRKDKNLYFGPYSSAVACRQTVDFIEKYFNLRTCSDHELNNRSRPCLQYQIHRCPAPCVKYINEENYRSHVEKARLFLQGRNQDLVKELKQEMNSLSEKQEYEKAAHRRDLVCQIQETLEKQSVVRHKFIDQDFVAFCREGERLTMAVLMVREGKVFDTHIS
ncbi:MAG: excinuclease ABC subunit UvrC, partial [bacterium]|nr:excinuclease ABC subunit UvrC [bacterium]